jgi:hypothetical protein
MDSNEVDSMSKHLRPPRDGAFFVRSPARVNGATLQENAAGGEL